MPRLTSFNGFLLLDRSFNEAWLLGLRLVPSSLSPVAPSKRRAHPMWSPHLGMHSSFPGLEHASCLICTWSSVTTWQQHPHLHKAFCLLGHSLAPSPCPPPSHTVTEAGPGAGCCQNCCPSPPHTVSPSHMGTVFHSLHAAGAGDEKSNSE